MKTTLKSQENINLPTIIATLLIVLLVFSGRFQVPLLNFPAPFYVGLFMILIMTIIIFMYKEIEIVKKTFNFILLNLIFFLYLITRSFSHVEYNLKLFEMILYVIPLIIFIALFIKSKKDIQIILLSIYLLTLLFGIIGLTSQGTDVSRLSVFGGGSNVYGRYMVFGFVLSFYYLIKVPKKHQKSIIILFIIMFLFLIIQTASRQAFFGVLLTLTIFITSFFSLAIINKKLKVKNLFMISILLIAVYNLFIKFTANTLFLNRIKLLFSQDKGSSVSARLSMIDTAKQMFEEAPLLGKGTGGFQIEMNSSHSYPHNIIYELLSEYGIVGLCLFSLTVFYVIFKGLKLLIYQIHNNFSINIIITLFTMFFLSIYFSLISGDLYDSRWIWFYGMLIVTYTYSIYRWGGDIYETN